MAGGLLIAAAVVAAWVLLTAQPSGGVGKAAAIRSAQSMVPAGAHVIEASVGRCDAMRAGSSLVHGCGHDRWVWAIDFDRGLSRSCGSAAGANGCGPSAQSTRVLVDYFTGHAEGAQSPAPERS